MLYRAKTLGVLCPVICIATRSGALVRTRFRTACTPQVVRDAPGAAGGATFPCRDGSSYGPVPARPGSSTLRGGAGTEERRRIVDLHGHIRRDSVILGGTRFSETLSKSAERLANRAASGVCKTSIPGSNLGAQSDIWLLDLSGPPKAEPWLATRFREGRPDFSAMVDGLRTTQMKAAAPRFQSDRSDDEEASNRFPSMAEGRRDGRATAGSSFTSTTGSSSSLASPTRATH